MRIESIFSRPIQRYALCSFGLSATSQQYFFLRTNQSPATSQQYFFLRTNQHQPSATSQTNRPVVGEFRKTRHPRNVKFDKVLEMCFSGIGNSRFSEAWNL
jgi:hypothetical protein